MSLHGKDFSARLVCCSASRGDGGMTADGIDIWYDELRGAESLLQPKRDPIIQKQGCMEGRPDLLTGGLAMQAHSLTSISPCWTL